MRKLKNSVFCLDEAFIKLISNALQISTYLEPSHKNQQGWTSLLLYNIVLDNGLKHANCYNGPVASFR